jgi:hypothetical protein
MLDRTRGEKSEIDAEAFSLDPRPHFRIGQGEVQPPAPAVGRAISREDLKAALRFDPLGLFPLVDGGARERLNAFR